jgi:hypothetical protein
MRAIIFTRRPVITTALALVLAAAAPGGAAIADGDGKGYPGSTCRADAATADVSMGTNAVVWNVSAATTQTWFCPAIQDRADGSALVTGRISVADRHFSKNVCCTLGGRNKFGGTVETSTRCTSGSSTEDVFDLLFDAPVSTASHGHLNIHCTVPEMYQGWGSGIVSYYLEEQF